MSDEASRIQSCIDHIKTAVDVDPWAKELCEQIMSKAIPVKPDTEPDEYGTTISYYCPSCCAYFGKRGIHGIAIFDKPYYCKCGQHIDWSE